MYSESQLKRIERWAHYNEPVAWADDGLPELPADVGPTPASNPGVSGPRQVVQGLLRHLQESKRDREQAWLAQDRALEREGRALSTRIDETARAMLVALYSSRASDERSKGEIAALAYQWARILELAREEKP